MKRNAVSRVDPFFCVRSSYFHVVMAAYANGTVGSLLGLISLDVIFVCIYDFFFFFLL